MKRIFTAAFLSASAILSAFAFDFGGALSSLSKFSGKTDDLYFNQKTSASLWLRTPLDKEGDIYLAAEGNLAFENNLETEKKYSDSGPFAFEIQH